MQKTILIFCSECFRFQNLQSLKTVSKTPFLSSPPQTKFLAVKHDQSPDENSKGTQFYPLNTPGKNKPVSACYMCATEHTKKGVGVTETDGTAEKKQQIWQSRQLSTQSPGEMCQTEESQKGPPQA